MSEILSYLKKNDLKLSNYVNNFSVLYFILNVNYKNRATEENKGYGLNTCQNPIDLPLLVYYIKIYDILDSTNIVMYNYV